MIQTMTAEMDSEGEEYMRMDVFDGIKHTLRKLEGIIEVMLLTLAYYLFEAVFKIFCKCAKRGTQRISRARGLRLRACANAATASAAWPWQVAGEMLKWGTDGRPMKVLIPVTVGTISIAFSRRSVKAGVERTLSLRPRMVNRRSACQDT